MTRLNFLLHAELLSPDVESEKFQELFALRESLVKPTRHPFLGLSFKWIRSENLPPLPEKDARIQELLRDNEQMADECEKLTEEVKKLRLKI